MARNLAIKCLRATRAALTTQAGASNLLEGELYLITDEAVLAIGLTDSTYAECLMSVDQFWQRNGTVLSPATSGDTIEAKKITTTGGAVGGSFTGTVSGMQATGGSGFAIAVSNSTNGATAGGIMVTAASEYAPSLLSIKSTTLTDSVTLLNSNKHDSSGTAAAGFGYREQGSLQTTVCETTDVILTDVDGGYTVKEDKYLADNGALELVQTIDGYGKLSLHKYGSGTHTGTATKYLAVTSAGVVIEQAPPDESKWDKTGTTLSPKTANDVVSVTTTGDIAIYGESAGLLKGAVKGHNALGYGGYFTGGAGGVYSEVTAGAAYVGIATTGYGTTLQNSTTAAPVIYATKKNADTDSVGIMETLRRESTDAGAAGLGIAREYLISDETKDLVLVGQENIILTDATEDGTSAKYELHLRRGGTWERKVEVSHTGQLTLDLYGAGTFTGTETKLLAVTSAGAVVETAIQGTATQKITYGTELTAAANLSRANHCFKETHFNKSSAANLTLLNADWLVGDWGVIRQIDEQATIVPEDATVIITGGTKTYGAGSALRFSCYKIDSGDKYFMIDGGSE